jgi:diguanylate cyclase (GGDEF)-like protein/PAS domain S-box-containing protein/putative nucleotidyltransferase with HDIG domain
VNAVRLSPKRFIGYVQDITSRKNTEKALCEQKNFSENVINTARVIILNLDTEGRIINFNPYMEEISGFSIADVKGQDWFETFLPTGQQSSVRKIFCDAIYDIKTHGNINAVKTKSGQLRYIEWYDSTIKDEVGNVQGLLAVGIDITNRKKYEEEREELLQRMQNMFNEHTAAMLIIEPVTGKIIDANPAACSFYGYTQEEMLKMHIQKINMLLKEEVEKRRLMAANRKQKYFLFPHRLKNGDIKMVDVYSAPVTYSGQKMLFSIIFDVTDREKYREELFWEKEQFKTTLLSVGDGVISTDFQGKVQLINKVAQQLTGWTQEEAFERPLEEVFNIINENTREKCENPAYKVLNTGQVVELDNHTVLISKEGAEIPIEDSAAPIRDKGDNITGVVLVFRDCTEKKEKRKKILYLSYHDQLTGLYNRRFYEEELKRIDTKRHFPLTIMMMDVNGLKLINDAFGHSIGDQVLIKTAEVLKRECRTDDIIARIGGDEFVMLLPMTDSKQAECIAERIKQVVEIEKIKSINISISLGWEIKKDNLVETDIIIKKAEDNMYKSKITESASHRNNTIALIMKTLFEKSQREEKHSKRVAALSRLIAAKLGLSLEKINIIKTAGLLHDIGKITISEKVLNKSTSLGKDEWNEIKRHPETGYNILKSVEEYAHIAEYILNHHEKWDGTGYPRGLKGKEIPLQSRILAVADAYDAMTMERPYKKAMNKKEVTAELKKYSETQFDPEIVRIFIEKIISNQ